MNIIALQTNIVWENKPANYEKAQHLLAQSSPSPGDLVVLPEMFATGFNMNISHIAELPAGQTETFLSQIARKYQIHLLAGHVASAPHGKAFNQAVLVNPNGEIQLRYTKIHPFSYAHEDQYFIAGSELFFFDWAGFKVCPFVCYDLRFPELFRIAVRRGADLFIVIANWPKRRKLHWETLLRARAIENLAFVVGVNRTGSDPNVSYPGLSQMIDPQGKILAHLEDEETFFSISPDRNELQTYRERFPALRDMRPDFLAQE
jgi:predicted amidohydrolase